jgi:uncharacterized membrane protein
MTILIIGILLFGGSHLFSVIMTPIRNRLSAWLGESSFKGIYSTVSIVGLGMMFWGYGLTRDNGDSFYVPPLNVRYITMLLVLVGFVLMSASYGKSYLKLWLQNPFSIGVCLWSIAHLIANGKTPVVIIYLTLLFIAAADIVNNMARGNRPMFEPNAKFDVIAILVGLAVYTLMLFVVHPHILGIQVLE